jgi:predicted dehydrogenase
VNVFGTTGRVELEIPYNALPDRPSRGWHQAGGKLEEFAIPACDQYGLQGDRFALAVRNDTPVETPIEDAVANMRVIEAVFESHRLGRWVDVRAAER